MAAAITTKRFIADLTKTVARERRESALMGIAP